MPFDFVEEPQFDIEEEGFDFSPEEVPQLQFPVLAPGATLADALRHPTPIIQPWEGGVVRSAFPGSLQPEDLLPAVRKIGGEVAVGEQGDTHPDIIEREDIPAVEIDQRGFMGPQGFMDRESAATALQAPTAFEPGRLHSTDLSTLQEPQGYQRQLEKIAEEEGPQPLVKLPEVPEFLKQAYSAPVRAIMGDKASDIEVAAADALYKSAKSVPEFLTTEEGMLSLLASLVPVGRLGVEAYFARDMANKVVESAKSMGEAWDRMTSPQKAAQITQIASEVGLTAMLAKAGAGTARKFMAKPEPPIIPREEAPPTGPTPTPSETAPVPVTPKPEAAAPTEPAPVAETKATLTPTIRLPDGRQFTGRSHGDIIIKIARETGEPELIAEADKPQNKGFQDQNKNFLSRSEAVPVFKKLTGKDPGIADALQSEDFRGHEDLMDLGEKPAPPPAAAPTPAAPVSPVLPEVKPGFVRLFSGTQSPGDISSWFTTDLKRAATFGHVRFVDVPADVAAAAAKEARRQPSGTAGDHVLPNEWANKAVSLRDTLLKQAEAAKAKPAETPKPATAPVVPRPEKGLPESATQSDLLADMTEAGRTAFKQAKATPDGFSSVDVTDLSAADRRNLARLGLSLSTDRQNRIQATYPQKLRAEDLRKAVQSKRATPAAATAAAKVEGAPIGTKVLRGSHTWEKRPDGWYGTYIGDTKGPSKTDLPQTVLWLEKQSKKTTKDVRVIKPTPRGTIYSTSGETPAPVEPKPAAPTVPRGTIGAGIQAAPIETRLSTSDKAKTPQEKAFRATAEGQKAMASRASRIATLSLMNEGIRKLDPNEAYSKELIASIPDSQIEKWQEDLRQTWNALKQKQGTIGGGIQAALARKSEAGAVTIPEPVVRAVEKTRDTIKTLAKTKGVRDTMAYTKDVAGNAAMVYGQRAGNNIRGELRRAMGRTKKPNVLDENALTFVREANGDRAQLDVMRAKLNASTVANPKWKNAALKAIDHADANWDRLNPIASQYEGVTHAQIMAENNAGINTVERPGYVMHAQDVKNEFGFFSDVAGEGTTGFKHVRTHDTLADSIAAGVDPKSINAVTLLTQRVARGQMLINNRAWVEGLKGTVDPLTRKTVITEPEVISRGPGLPPDTRAPEGYVMEIAGGRPIAVLKPYAGIFRALTEPSKFSESLGWNMALKTATTGKSISLLIDTFHLGRIAFWESIIKPLSFTDPKLPIPSYRRGVLTLDYSPAELNRMAAAGEIKPAHLADILQAQRDVNGLVKHGYNIAKISDMLHQEWMQKIPVTGWFTKWLFNQFQRGAMAEVGSLEVGRYRRMHPSWTEEKVYREVAKDLNTRFGNLGRQGILKSRTAQDTARLLFLAPQWNEGLIRSELGAITGAVKGIASTAKEGRLSFGILPRAVGAMIVAQFAANQLINYITRGKPTWQNEEEGLGAKLSAWVPDVVGKGPGFFLHPLGLAAEITHLLTQKYEKKGDAREAIMAFMGGRLSTLSRPLMTFLTRRDIFQRLIRPEKIWGETAKSAIPSPIGAQSVVPAIGERLGGEPKEPFVGAYQKQMMSSMGVKTDQAPSPGQRIQTLAQKFKKEKGITTPGEFYGSAYTPLREAVQRGSLKESLAEYDRLLDTVAPSGKRYTAEQIDNAMKPWTGGRINKQTYMVSPRRSKTFTGSAAKEREFINTLTPEQKETYRRAYQDRVQFYNTFRQILRNRAKATNEPFGFRLE